LVFGYKKNVRTGQDLDNLIGTPLSYNRYALSDQFNLKLKKYWSIEFEPSAIVKTYFRENYDRFMYVDNGLKTVVGYRYNLKKKVGHLMDVNVHQRNYLISKTGANGEGLEWPLEGVEEGTEPVVEEFWEEEETNELNRIWRYYALGYGVKIPINEKLKITGRIAYTHRSDVLQQRLGYNQLSAQVGLNFKRKKWKTEWNISAYQKNYTDFTFENTENNAQLLVYHGVKYGFNARYQLTKQLDLSLKGVGKMRFSNANNISSRSMRSYALGEVSAGVIWTLKKEFKAKKRKS